MKVGENGRVSGFFGNIQALKKMLTKIPSFRVGIFIFEVY